MSERKWTGSQLSAIEFRGKNLILSAAAGSGKTATLTERIIRLLKDRENPCDLDRMLIVTFTTAAAGELKERIAASLSSAMEKEPENLFLARQLAALEGAQISTIDSFFKAAIRPFSLKTGLNFDFSILDEAEASVLRREAMLETITAHFDGEGYAPSKDFRLFSDAVSTARSEADLCESLLGICSQLLAYDTDEKKLMSLAAKLRESADRFFETEYCTVIREELSLAAEHFKLRFQSLANRLSTADETVKYTEEAERLSEMAEGLLSVTELDYKSALSFFASVDFPRLSPIKRGCQSEDYEVFKDIRNEFKDCISSFREDYFSADEEMLADAILKTADHIGTLSKVYKYFDDTYSSEKRERGAADFSDLSRFAREIFVSEDGKPTEAALELGEKYDYIFIDEYQDTNALQDSIFAAVSGRAGRFMVGDVKQSIYGFRGSCPELFTGYRKKYESGDEGCAVFMSENFRSDRCVIDFANAVSRYIFKGGKTPFEKEDELVCSKLGGDSKNLCEVIFVEKNKDEDEPQLTEAECVSRRISELLSGEILSDGTPITPGHIAILLRSSTEAEEYARCLTEMGIPVTNSASEEFFDYGEVLLVLCLLNTADNPLRDIYLAGAMKSPVFGFSVNDLVNMRESTDIPLWYSVKEYSESGRDKELSERCREFAGTVNRWREAAKDLYADEMLRLIVSDTDLVSYGGDGVRKNSHIVKSLKTLSDMAASVAKRGGMLHELIVHINSAIEKKDKAVSFSDPDSVTILTVHRSKGLEYPICFFAEGSKRFNTRDTSEKLITDRSGRIGMKLYDNEGLVRCDNPIRRTVAMQMQKDSFEEEARVLYVAMTRARERLIVSCKVKDIEKTLEKARLSAEFPLDAYEVNSKSSAGEWIINALEREGKRDFFVYKNGADIKGVPYVAKANNASFDEELLSFFEKSIDFSYDKEYLWNIPAKLSVSVLKPDLLGEDKEKTYFDAPEIISMEKEAPLPEFMKDKREADAAAMGTATHLFMQFCDFRRLYERGAEAELECLLEKGFISKADSELVRLSEIELFRKSDLIKRLMGAKTILRERRFNTILPAADFTMDEELKEKLCQDGVTVTVQGVVDCIFINEDKKAVLVDYKTDRLTREELENVSLAEAKLRERHSRQLTIYKCVCEQMLGQSFDEVSVYSLPLGKTVSI